MKKQKSEEWLIFGCIFIGLIFGLMLFLILESAKYCGKIHG